MFIPSLGAIQGECEMLFFQSACGLTLGIVEPEDEKIGM